MPFNVTRYDLGSYTSMPAPLGDAARVLVAEDDPVQAQVLLLFLERLGVSAVHVDDGEKAVEALESHEFAMVLMDCLMPRMDGVEATRAIRRREKALGWERMPIIAVTASTMKNECERYVAAGMDEILAKPFAAGDLRALLMRYLSVETPSV